MAKIYRFEAKLLEVNDVTPTVKLFIFSTPEDFTFTAGQFVSLKIPKGEGKFKVTPYSIGSSPQLEGKLELVVKKVEGGLATSYLWKMSVGDSLNAIGAMGKFVFERSNKDVLFIATGTGIAPFRSTINDLLSTGYDKEITLFAGCRYEDEILFKTEFEELQIKHNNFKYHPAVSRPRDANYSGDIGRVQVLVDKYLPKGFSGDVYLCGLWDMIKTVQEKLLAKGIKKEQIHYERYD